MEEETKTSEAFLEAEDESSSVEDADVDPTMRDEEGAGDLKDVRRFGRKVRERNWLSGKTKSLTFGPFRVETTEVDVFKWIMGSMDGEHATAEWRPVKVQLFAPKRVLHKHELLASFGYAEFASPEMASQMLDTLKTTAWPESHSVFRTEADGSRDAVDFCVGYCMPPRVDDSHTSGKQQQLEGVSNWIKISGIPPTVTQQSLADWLASKMAGVQPLKVKLTQHRSVFDSEFASEKTDSKKSESKKSESTLPRMGYARVELHKAGDAKRAAGVWSLQSAITLEGAMLHVAVCNEEIAAHKFNRNAKLKSNTQSVLVSNLPYDAKSEEVKELLSKFGTVRNVKMWYSKLGYPFGKATVYFDERLHADRAVSNLNDTENPQSVFRGGNQLRVAWFAPGVGNKKKRTANFKKKLALRLKKKAKRKEKKIALKAGKRLKKGKSGAKVSGKRAGVRRGATRRVQKSVKRGRAGGGRTAGRPGLRQRSTKKPGPKRARKSKPVFS